MSPFNRYRKASPEERAAFPPRARARFDAQIATEAAVRENEVRRRAALDLRLAEEAARELALCETAWAAGFPREYLPVFYGVGTPNQTVAPGLCRLKVQSRYTPSFLDTFQFNGFPALPLRGGDTFVPDYGDESAKWVIDANGDVWVGSYELVKKDYAYLRDGFHPVPHELLVEIHKLLGRKPPLEEFAKEALARGWGPPADFKREDFE